MTSGPMEFADSLRIGTVCHVSPDEIIVTLDLDAPMSMSLNTGSPRPFPRVNSYVLISSENGYLVGQVEWLTVEESNYPKRKGMKDFGLVDLPYPIRKMRVNPLGMLRVKDCSDDVFLFERGADTFPSVGDCVILPTGAQLRSIVEPGKNRRVKIGTSPLAGNAEIRVDPDRLFGRHLAVLGNTGSGKSCTVAGLIRWSLEAASERMSSDEDCLPNARFIIMDPNGEYSSAFGKDDTIKARVITVEPTDQEKALNVPLWFWNGEEWCSLTLASAKTQRPLLRRALREVKAGRANIARDSEEEKKLYLRKRISMYVTKLRYDINSQLFMKQATQFGNRLEAMDSNLESIKGDYPDYCDLLNTIHQKITEALDKRRRYYQGKYYEAFHEPEVQSIVLAISDLLKQLGGVLYFEGPSEDTPVSFFGTDLVDYLELLAEDTDAPQHLDFFLMRIRTMLSDSRMKSIISNQQEITLEQWLNDYIGANEACNGNVVIIDLSLVPFEIMYLVTSVIARMIFEALQRYRKMHAEKKILPTVLVMEEAHNFIKRYKDDDAENISTLCCKVFERIAKEGRKFGLGLVLSSQRPSELSPTVLSQCNSFLIHRINNDRDQEIVHRYVPDNLKGLLRDLPVLPSQHAILLGWASELPLLVRINDLSENQKPLSDDPDFWRVWTGAAEREVNWRLITDDWQEIGRQANQATEENNADNEEDALN